MFFCGMKIALQNQCFVEDSLFPPFIRVFLLSFSFLIIKMGISKFTAAGPHVPHKINTFWSINWTCVKKIHDISQQSFNVVLTLIYVERTS